MWGSGVLTGKPSAGPAESENSQISDREPTAPRQEVPAGRTGGLQENLSRDVGGDGARVRATQPKVS